MISMNDNNYKLKEYCQKYIKVYKEVNGNFAGIDVQYRKSKEVLLEEIKYKILKHLINEKYDCNTYDVFNELQKEVVKLNKIREICKE